MKKHNITRTITNTKALVKFADLNVNIVFEDSITIPGRYDSFGVIEYIKESFGDTTGRIPVGVSKIDYEDCMYTISIEKFVAYADSCKSITPEE